MQAHIQGIRLKSYFLVVVAVAVVVAEELVVEPPSAVSVFGQSAEMVFPHGVYAGWCCSDVASRVSYNEVLVKEPYLSSRDAKEDTHVSVDVAAHQAPTLLSRNSRAQEANALMKKEVSEQVLEEEPGMLLAKLRQERPEMLLAKEDLGKSIQSIRRGTHKLSTTSTTCTTSRSTAVGTSETWLSSSDRDPDLGKQDSDGWPSPAATNLAPPTSSGDEVLPPRKPSPGRNFRRTLSRRFTQKIAFLRRGTTLCAASKRLPAASAPASLPLHTCRIQATMAEVYEAVQDHQRCPLRKFLRDAAGAYDFHDTQWQACKSISDTQVRKVSYMVPVPNDIPSIARKLGFARGAFNLFVFWCCC
ncbi:unnamed protein product [Polarella glacialis]|uniref:Uncharacterized protein n=2 Tax=Polarella glacialis TaxID=89957 RepID=A0A813GC31_POLGL|nr:unnamed protein product [Polarella glacialis]